MQKSNAAGQPVQEESESLTPATEYTAQELDQAIREALPAIMKLLRQK